jgi:hypothetical protein
MITYKLIETNTVDKIICDKCSKEIDSGATCEHDDDAVFIGYMGGYNSKIGDGAKINIELCSSCFEKMLLDYFGFARYDELLGRSNS